MSSLTYKMLIFYFLITQNFKVLCVGSLSYKVLIFYFLINERLLFTTSFSSMSTQLIQFSFPLILCFSLTKIKYHHHLLYTTHPFPNPTKVSKISNLLGKCTEIKLCSKETTPLFLSLLSHIKICLSVSL